MQKILFFLSFLSCIIMLAQPAAQFVIVAYYKEPKASKTESYQVLMQQEDDGWHLVTGQIPQGEDSKTAVVKHFENIYSQTEEIQIRPIASQFAQKNLTKQEQVRINNQLTDIYLINLNQDPRLFFEYYFELSYFGVSAEKIKLMGQDQTKKEKVGGTQASDSLQTMYKQEPIKSIIDTLAIGTDPLAIQPQLPEKKIEIQQAKIQLEYQIDELDEEIRKLTEERLQMEQLNQELTQAQIEIQKARETSQQLHDAAIQKEIEITQVKAQEKVLERQTAQTKDSSIQKKLKQEIVQQNELIAQKEKEMLTQKQEAVQKDQALEKKQKEQQIVVKKVQDEQKQLKKQQEIVQQKRIEYHTKETTYETYLLDFWQSIKAITYEQKMAQLRDHLVILRNKTYNLAQQLYRILAT